MESNKNQLPINGTDKFIYSITFQETTPESAEAGDYSSQGFEVDNEVEEMADILRKAYLHYGINYPISSGSWETTSPSHDRNYFEKGIERYYALHVKHVDGTPLTQDEHNFITALMNRGRYSFDEQDNEWYENGGETYSVGGIIVGTLLGAFLGYRFGLIEGEGKGLDKIAKRMSDGGGIDNWRGVDADLETSLEEYQFVATHTTKDYPDEYWVIYKIGDDLYGHSYIRESELNSLINGEEWADEDDVDSFLKTVGQSKSDWMTLSFESKLSDLIGYWGTENILGTDYSPNDKKWAYSKIGIEPTFDNGGGVGKEKKTYGISGIVWYITKESAGSKYDYLSDAFLEKQEFDKYLDNGMIEQTRFRINVAEDWLIVPAIYKEMSENDKDRGLEYEQGRNILGYKLLLDNQDSGFGSSLPYDDEDNDDDGYAKGGGVGDKQKVVDAVLEQMKENIEIGDVTVEEELFMKLPKRILIGSLPEEDWDKYMSKNKEKVVDAVLEQMKKNVEIGDVTVEEELFMKLPKRILVGSLPEEDWDKYAKGGGVGKPKMVRSHFEEEEFDKYAKGSTVKSADTLSLYETFLDDKNREVMRILAQSIYSEERLKKFIERAEKGTFDMFDKGRYDYKQEVFLHPRGVREPYLDKYKKFTKGGSTYSGGGELEEWQSKAIQSLRDSEGDDSIDFVSDETDYVRVESEDSGAEYVIFETQDDAERFAIARVTEDLEENPEYFTESWLLQHIDQDQAELFFREVFGEWDMSYATDIMMESSERYENRLIEEMVDMGIMSEEDAESEEANDIANERIEQFAELITDDKISEGNGGFDYYKSNFGDKEAFDLLSRNNLIDVGEASEDAVNTDGIGHFISSYDGLQIDLSDNAVAYRTN
jgi:hypothetical protein